MKDSPLTTKQQDFVMEYQCHEDVDRALADSGIVPAEIPIAGFYVYFLIDPRFNSIFYIGKGKKNRVRAHEAAVMSRGCGKSLKEQRIADVHKEGHAIRTLIFSTHSSGREAFRVESRLIAELRDCGLTNVAGVNSETYHDRQIRRADWMLSRLMPFDVWVRSLTTVGKRVITNVFGSPREFYDKFVENVQRLKTEMPLREIVVVERFS